MREAAKKEGRTVLYVSHNMNTIRRLCDRCIVLDKGKIIFEGDVEEAIAIYSRNLHDQWADGQTEFDLRETKSRSPWVPATARVTYLKLLDKERAMYAAGEPLKILLRIETTRDYANLRLRLEFRYRDETPVGTIPNMLLGAFHAGECREYLAEVPPIGLTSGKYRIDLVLFELDDVGNTYDQELLTPACVFEMLGQEEIVWNNSTWGHIRFPDAKVMRLR